MRKFLGSQYGADLNNFPYGICKYLALERGRKTPGERHLLAFMSCVCRHHLWIFIIWTMLEIHYSVQYKILLQGTETGGSTLICQFIQFRVRIHLSLVFRPVFSSAFHYSGGKYNIAFPNDNRIAKFRFSANMYTFILAVQWDEISLNLSLHTAKVPRL